MAAKYEGGLLTLPGTDLTRADQHCIALHLSMAIMEARTMAHAERAAYLRRCSGSGPHGGSARFSEGAVEEIVQRLAREEAAAAEALPG